VAVTGGIECMLQNRTIKIVKYRLASREVQPISLWTETVCDAFTVELLPNGRIMKQRR
jgi:hypothetical protein